MDYREKFIKKSKEIYGDKKYDYSKVIWNGCKEKVTLKCNIHNVEFEQKPSLHYFFEGCPICSSMKKGDLHKDTVSDFIEKAIKIHGNKYDYSKVNYINSNTKVCIICPIHGEFWQQPNKHLSGQGCSECGKLKRNDRLTTTNDEFTLKAKKVHSDKYDYSKVKYINALTKVCIVCPEHGEFWQSPNKHLQGQGCPECSKINLSKKQTSTITDFIKKANIIHNNKYVYNKAEYVNNQTKICIICPEHGEFWQTPQSHLNGCGCPMCANKKRNEKRLKNIEQFINESKIIHNDKYDYSKVNYINSSTKVCIVCPEHGEFWQSPNKHLQGQGCPECCGNLTYDNNGFIKRAKEIHGDSYDYSKVNYINNKNKVCIVCHKTDKNGNEHGEFWQEASSHLSGNGCPKCGNIISYQENKLVDFIKETLNNEHSIINNDRTILNGKELDIYIPSLKLAIEYDGLLWHSELFGKDKNYHLNKTLECKRRGIRLIHIFEDEWLYRQDIVKSKLRHLFGYDSDLEKVYARTTKVMKITSDIAKDFLEKNHIQGFANGTIHLGCYSKDCLIGVMSFKKERNDKNDWELIRFATDINKHCVGVGGKLFAYFIDNYDYNIIKSFADRRWTLNKENNLYTRLGFILDNVLKPDYKYFYRKATKMERIHKFNFRKRLLNKKYGLSLEMTENEMTDKLGFHKIWDCGLYKYVFKNDETK